MISTLSLSNVLTVFVALVCLWTTSPQARGGVMRLWRLALPAAFSAVVALMLLASVFEANLQHDAEWVAALLLGGLIGRARGWALRVDIDQNFGLVRLPRSMDGLVGAFGILAMSVIDFASSVQEEAIIEPEHVASIAAGFAGFIGWRALAMITRATRAPHVRLRDATRG